MKTTLNAALAGAAFAAIALPQAAAAQIAVEANAAYAEDNWGGELGVLYNLEIGDFTLRPGGGVFLYEGDNDRYYTDELSNGQSRCRDRTNGQFADDSNCINIAARAYARLEATYTIPGSVEIGAGGRYSGDRIRPYATLSAPLGERLRIKGNAGDDYFALGLRADF